MPDIVMSCNMDADAETVWRAITTTDGVTGWFTGHAEIGDGAGGHHLLTFPEMPAPWDLRVEDSRPARRLTLSVQAGPPEWQATTMTYEIADRAGGGIVLNFDHNDFATVDSRGDDLAGLEVSGDEDDRLHTSLGRVRGN